MLHPDMQDVHTNLLKWYDHSIIESYRTEANHKRKVANKQTRIPYSKTNHRFNPSRASDSMPYPTEWTFFDELKIASDSYVLACKALDDLELSHDDFAAATKRKEAAYKKVLAVVHNISKLYYYCGAFRGIAETLGVPIRQGCDWDRDLSFNDQNFHDIPHNELFDEGSA